MLRTYWLISYMLVIHQVIYNNIDYQSSQEIINYGFHLEMIHYNLRLIAVLKRLFKTHIIKMLLIYSYKLTKLAS